MTGTWLVVLAIFLVSITTKTIGYMNSPILISTSLNTFLGRLVDLSANWITILVGFSSPNPSPSYSVMGIKLTLSLKSSKAL